MVLGQPYVFILASAGVSVKLEANISEYAHDYKKG